MPSNSCAHVVDRVDRDAEPADFAERARIVAVEAHQRRQVERRAQPGLPLLEQELEPLVRLRRPCRSRRTAASSTAGSRYIDA